MGHHALVAYERPDSSYNLHFSCLGARELRLKNEITPDAPFGGKNPRARWSIELLDTLLRATDEDEIADLLGDNRSVIVNPSPIALGITFEEIVSERLDYLHHEAFYVVSTEFEVTAYRTYWFGFHKGSDGDDETVGNGALRTVYWYDGEPAGDGHAEGEFQALKAVVEDLLERGIFDREEAVSYMKEKLVEWSDDRADLIIRTRL